MDKILTCADCRSEFTFTEGEQAFFTERGFSEPRRCPTCRAARKASGGGAGGGYASGGSYSGGDRPARSGAREMFTATCATCGKEARVPFVPNGSRPVYCSDCFASAPR